MTDHEPFKNNFANTLSRYVGRGREWSVEAIAAASGIKARRIYALLEADHQPNLTDLTLLGRELPAAFLSEALEAAGVVSITKRQEPMNNPHMMQSRVCAIASDLAEKLEDGRLDHRERADAEPKLRRLRDDIDAFLSSNVRPMQGAAE